MKNNHIIWAYADVPDGSGKLVILGLTDEGIAYLKAGEGTRKKTLVIDPPNAGFFDIKQIVVFHEKDKATLKETLGKSGLIISEVN